MYSWGDDTSTWKKSGEFKYDKAKAPYLDSLKKEAEEKGPKSYSTKKGPNLQLVDPREKNIYTESENPIFFWIDGTGSMAKRPEWTFDRSPLLYQTLVQYRPDVEVCFGVIGDAKYDQWPLQAGNIGKGPALDDVLKALHAEGRGGPGIRESYELAAYFMNEHIQAPKAVNPFLFILGDEKFYDQISPEEVKKVFGDKLQGPLDSLQVWKALANKYDLYFLRKKFEGRDEEILAQWKEAVGPQKVIDVPYGSTMEEDRVIDVALGIVAKTWGNYSNFLQNLSARQDSETVAKVKESIRAAPIDGEVGDMKSKYNIISGAKKSKILMEG